MAQILAIDDEIKILRLLKNGLGLQNHNVTTVENPLSIEPEQLKQYDLILLDVMMPQVDGFTFCKKIRDEVVCPIIFLTAKIDENAVIEGLLSGGDDYIKKPFGIKELNARVEAHLRREGRKKQAKRLVLDEVTIFLDQREIQVKGQAVSLTKSQYNICEYLALNRGRVFSKDQIYDAVYSLDSDTMISTITEHIRVVRAKFKERGCQPIETVWGVGYKWV